MNREDAREQLSAYLDGELEPAVRLALEAALAEDAELRAELDALRRTVALVQGLPHLPAPDGLAGRVLAAVDASAEPGGWARRWIPVALAAAACLVIGIASLLGRSGAPAAKRLPSTKDAGTSPRREAVAEERLSEDGDPKRRAEERSMGGLAKGPGDVKRDARLESAPVIAAPSPRGTIAMRKSAGASVTTDVTADHAAAVRVARGRGTESAPSRDDLLLEDIRSRGEGRAVASTVQDSPAASDGRVVRAIGQYDDLERCLREARSVLEGAGATYVVQPVGAGRFTVETTLPQAKARAVLARLRRIAQPQGDAAKGGAKHTDAAEPAAPLAPHATVAQAPAEHKSKEGGPLVHLVVQFESRNSPGPPASKR